MTFPYELIAWLNHALPLLATIFIVYAMFYLTIVRKKALKAQREATIKMQEIQQDNKRTAEQSLANQEAMVTLLKEIRALLEKNSSL